MVDRLIHWLPTKLISSDINRTIFQTPAVLRVLQRRLCSQLALRQRTAGLTRQINPLNNRNPYMHVAFSGYSSTMTNYTPPRSSQDLNQFTASPQLTIPHYADNDNINYNYSPHPHYENVSPTYSTYAASFVSSQNKDTHYWSDNLQMAAQYPYSTPLLGNTASHHRTSAQTTPYSFQQASQYPLSQSPRYTNSHDHYQPSDVESQESVNENTMLSEPVLPPLAGFPDTKDFDGVIHRSVLVLGLDTTLAPC